MKERILNWSIDKIKVKRTDLDEVKIKEIRYGLEGIYLSITKLIIIFSISLLLGITREFIIFLILYNIIRAFAFGAHANKSGSCLIVSIFIFVALPFLATRVLIPTYLVLSIGFILLILLLLFAPADTYKRPLIRRKKRLRLKIAAFLTGISYLCAALLIDNSFIINCLLFSLLLETILILPITYKILQLPYNNYKNYHIKS